MPTRREFLRWGVAMGAAVGVQGVLPSERAAAAASVAGGLTPYVDPLPRLVDHAVDVTSGGTVDLTTTLIRRRVHSQLPATTLFGYVRTGEAPASEQDSFLGPLIIARRGTPVTVRYTNDLASDAYRDVFGATTSYTQFTMDHSGTRTLAHLHGGFVAGADDGNPYASAPILPGGTQTVRYPNEQSAALLWYHDHFLGATRLNVVAGLAGGYLLRDSFDTGDNPDLPGGEYEVPLVIQDRRFTADGSLLYPVSPASENGPWTGEYFGDVMLVNGKVWPYLDVEPAVYRFRVLNGCNARIMNLKMSASTGAPVPMSVIGTDGGLRPGAPVATNRLLMGPAERFDVICDFRALAGQTVLLNNSNPPKPTSTPAPNLQRVMQFRVGRTTPQGAPSTVIRRLPDADESLTTLVRQGAPLLSGGSVPGRMVTLNEVGAESPAWHLTINGTDYMGAAPTVQTLTRDAVEDWYYVNTTMDTHPMHTHLFMFTVIGRYNLDVAGYVAKYGTPNGVQQQDVSTLKPFLKSPLMAPAPEEAGLKDTVRVNPGQVTVVRAQYRLPSTAVGPQRYVHHCHILEHEDNDMMERFEVS